MIKLRAVVVIWDLSNSNGRCDVALSMVRGIKAITDLRTPHNITDMTLLFHKDKMLLATSDIRAQTRPIDRHLRASCARDILGHPFGPGPHILADMQVTSSNESYVLLAARRCDRHCW